MKFLCCQNTTSQKHRRLEKLITLWLRAVHLKLCYPRITWGSRSHASSDRQVWGGAWGSCISHKLLGDLMLLVLEPQWRSEDLEDIPGSHLRAMVTAGKSLRPLPSTTLQETTIKIRWRTLERKLENTSLVFQGFAFLGVLPSNNHFTLNVARSGAGCSIIILKWT